LGAGRKRSDQWLKLWERLPMRVLFLGDIVGRTGHTSVCRVAARLRQEMQLDLLICNAENAADGTGLTVRQFEALVEAGVDGVSMGDHVYRKRELLPRLVSDPRLVRPLNFPLDAAGRGWTVLRAKNGQQAALLCVMGRTFMRPVDCPLRGLDRALAELPDDVSVKIVDLHAEATSDKQLVARYLDGRVSAVLGTHTHVPTADATILPRGTAFQADVGMCGPHSGVIGRAYEPVLGAALRFESNHYAVAVGDVRLNGALLEVDPLDGKARSIEPFRWHDAAA
jgi:metallophosphoesterase (TIGR00282 family)